MNVLVTGASGQLGVAIKSISHHYDKHFQMTFLTKLDLDITNHKSVARLFKNNNFDYCINCAAFTNVELAESTPDLAYEINHDAVKNLALVCKQNEVILVHISTDYVFDGNKSKPYTVDDTPSPINIYGDSKLKGEKAIQELMHSYFIIRTSWLFNKSSGKNFYRTILNKAINHEAIRVVDNQKSCPTDCDSLAKFILDGIKNASNKWGIHHFSGKTPMTWYAFAIQILKENNLLKSTDVSIDNNYVTFAKRPKYSVLENTVI
ncbi:dTDP-4-dehydrorhamnose reductase [Psychroserpens sp.]|uniref:dTDP-4-dehydrorhamnose reductase n=1 Tax=Psychroserpens sp. TaxID=2020870 RepID=UPI001B11BB16|nr:dTDP-4-dehydrorhamnose reductase [Psychroserpens sp.]MBO6605379.1 dTDP-4-dehydrorhamnose reductase [Psychroserpens sp.]MBO6630514.1 dTDP-4-dehydrorhamnose reductase [Psychroserpens sp.]MBO6653812.1 dTDP-4-dehydrorhamnose reductase [Psychroserpens sp.]MBO6682133.1 dTDP-4-dehydrorhamnose reductase [Psychroserpens sp.]MBO6748753.1 dTDP-4-dehydrorhamnose reductase [Psychroserpens sp.]